VKEERNVYALMWDKTAPTSAKKEATVFGIEKKNALAIIRFASYERLITFLIIGG